MSLCEFSLFFSWSPPLPYKGKGLGLISTNRPQLFETSVGHIECVLAWPLVFSCSLSSLYLVRDWAEGGGGRCVCGGDLLQCSRQKKNEAFLHYIESCCVCVLEYLKEWEFFLSFGLFRIICLQLLCYPFFYFFYFLFFALCLLLLFHAGINNLFFCLQEQYQFLYQMVLEYLDSQEWTLGSSNSQGKSKEF